MEERYQNYLWFAKLLVIPAPQSTKYKNTNNHTVFLKRCHGGDKHENILAVVSILFNLWFNWLSKFACPKKEKKQTPL